MPYAYPYNPSATPNHTILLKGTKHNTFTTRNGRHYPASGRTYICTRVYHDNGASYRQWSLANPTNVVGIVTLIHRNA